MMRTLRFAATALAILFVCAGVATAAPFDENRPKVGQKAHEFEIQGFKLSDLKGRRNLVMIFYRGHF
ncbi:MAG: hypothetical protein OXL41_07255 [Nitrospinae bacterium]|nr:hypothetical protein [Nitrospinota bacterium]